MALISWSQLNLLNWIFVGIGFGLSAAFLLRNLYPVLSATDKKTSKVLLVVVIVAHMALAVTIKWLFFAHHSAIKPGAGKSGEKPADPAPTAAAMF